MRFEATTPELLEQYQAEVESVVERAKKLKSGREFQLCRADS